MTGSGSSYSGDSGISINPDPNDSSAFIISAGSLVSSISGLAARVSDLENA